MAPHSSIPAWKIPWTEEPGRLQSVWSQRIGHNWATSLSQCHLWDLSFLTRHWTQAPAVKALNPNNQTTRELPGDYNFFLSERKHKFTWQIITTFNYMKYWNIQKGFLGGSAVKNLPANARDTEDVGSIPRLERSPEEGNGNPLQYSFLENPMDRGASWAIVHGVTESWTGLSDWAYNSNIQKAWCTLGDRNLWPHISSFLSSPGRDQYGKNSLVFSLQTTSLQ